MDQLAAVRAAQRAKWEKARVSAQSADALQEAETAAPKQSALSLSSTSTTVAAAAAATPQQRKRQRDSDEQPEPSSAQASSKSVSDEPVEAVAERIFQRLIRERGQALASAPVVPLTIMDLLEDAPPRPVPTPSQTDIACARMESLRRAYDEVQQRDDGPSAFCVQSWNIDGLDDHGDEDLLARLVGAVSHILTQRPAVVCLQEVIDPALMLLRIALEGRYEVIVPEPKVFQYYVVMLVSRTQVAHIRNRRTVSFPNSRMGRQLLLVDADLHGGKTAIFMTTHLESTKECDAERKQQLKVCCDAVDGGSADLITLAGDMNLRDPEAKAILSKYPRVKCAWEHLGSDKEHQFTWDTRMNDNCGIEGPRARFDRAFFHSKGIAPTTFKLVGTQRLPHGRFISDHWSLVTHWSVPTASTCKGGTIVDEISGASKPAKAAGGLSTSTLVLDLSD